MGRSKKLVSIMIPVLGMMILILDSKTALQGAAEGLDICIRSVIPSLLPFFVFSTLLVSNLMGKSTAILRPVARLCKIPEGAEPLLLVGFLGGYPAGAQCITRAYHLKQLGKQDALRLLGFCSNAGPAFIFGIVGSVFPSFWHAWLLWFIHVMSAFLVAMILPGKSSSVCSVRERKPDNLSKALMDSIRVLSGVCGWIILFRILIAFCGRWFLWLFPEELQVLLYGLLELANGCVALVNIESVPVRFVQASAMLGFGGLCVGMQTVSVTEGLGTGWYFCGKYLQGMLSIVFSMILQFGWQSGTVLPWILLTAASVFAVRYFGKKKAVAFSDSIVYNEENGLKEMIPCCSARRLKDPAFTAPMAPK